MVMTKRSPRTFFFEFSNSNNIKRYLYTDLCTDECTMGNRRILYVYNGKGISEVCQDQLFKSLSAVVHPDYYSVQYIQPKEIRHGEWKKNAALIAFGGGYDEGYIGALKRDGVKQVRSYVESGGSYLGLCAGGYFACDRIEFDKHGALSVCGERHLKFFPGVCHGPVFPGFEYRSFKGASAASITYKPLSGRLLTFSSYFNGGGMFSLHKGENAYKKVEVLAKYNNLPDSPSAIVKCLVGNSGVAVLTGIHPEYDSAVLAREDMFVRDFVDELDRWDKERVSCFIDILKHLRIRVNL